MSNNQRNDQMNLYSKRDFESLAKSNLKQPIDSNGNTIVHMMAKNGDKEAFERIHNINLNAFDNDVINAQNNKLQTPVHLAMENSKGHNLVNYLIDTLGANPNLPDNQNRIIVSNSDKENSRSIYMNDKYDKLNQTVIDNIRNLSKLAESNEHTPAPISSSSNVDFIKKLVDTYSYSQKGAYRGQRTIKGGYSDNDSVESFRANVLDSLDDSNGRGRYVSANDRNNRQNDDIDDANFDAYITADVLNGNRETDSDIVSAYAYDPRYKNETNNDVNQNLLNSANADTNNINSSNYAATLDQTDANNRGDGDTLWYDDVIPRDERLLQTYGGEYEKYAAKEAKLKRKQESIQNYRLINGDNEEMRLKEREVRNKLNKLINDYSYLIGGRRSRSNERDDNNNYTSKKIDKRKYNKGTKGNKGNTTVHHRGPRKLRRKANTSTERNDIRTDDINLFTDDNRSNENRSEDIKSENSNFRENYRRRNIWSDGDDDDEDMLMQDRPRDEKTDEMYRSFIKRIMDLLDVDEEKARFYRTALKINIENKNPELRRRVNDALKVKEMEKLMKDKNTLRKAIDEIDEGAIRNIMQEKETEGKRRREESEKNKKNRPRNRENRGNRETNSNRETNGNAETIPEAEPDTKSKRPRKTKNAPIEGGYLKSEEIIFSSDY